MRNKLNASPDQKLTLSLRTILIITGSSVALLAGVLLVLQSGSTTTTTTSPGTWNNTSNWSDDVPDNSAKAIVNHTLILDKNIEISSGSYTINAPVSDQPGGNAFSLSIGSDGTFEVKANMTFEGTGSVSNSGNLFVRSGDTLRLGATVFSNGSSVTVDEGGVLIINGNLENKNNSDGIVVNGKIIVNGNFSGGNGSEISGNGNFTTTGQMSGAGTVFGTSPLNCGGPCDGRSLQGFTNTITADQLICSGNSPATLTGTTSASNPSYKWQKSIDNINFITISGATAPSYSPGSLLLTTWYRRIVTFQNRSSTSATVKITVSVSGLWTGAVSSQWNNAGNWCGIIPLSGSNITIPAGCVNMPVIPSGNFSYADITISKGASLTISKGTNLTIKGDMINLGTFTDNEGTLLFSGSAPQNLTGITSMVNLTMNNSSSLILTNSVTVNGIIKLLKGVIISDGRLTVNLTTGGIAWQSTDNGSIFGNITLKKDVPSSYYHYLSSPLTSQTVAGWNDNVSIESGRIYYYYDETNTNPDNQIGWTGIGTLSTPLTPLQGYALYFRTARTMDNTGEYTHGTSAYNIPLTNTYSGGSGADGWNLVGNPYPSTIDWDASSGWTKKNVYNAVYCWDAANNRYTSYLNGASVNGGSRYISSMQAFWIRVDTTRTNGSLAITSAARTTSDAKFYKTSVSLEPILRISAIQNGNEDETLIRLIQDATDNFDGDLDAFKMMNPEEYPSLYTKTKGMAYAINSINIVSDETILPLELSVPETGLCKFSVKDISNFDAFASVTLEDNKLHTSQNLVLNPDYEFNTSDLQVSGRFTIKIKTPAVTTSINNVEENHSVQMTVQNNMLYVKNPENNSENAFISIVATSGVVMEEKATIHFNSGEFTYDLSGYQPGMYIVKAEINKKITTKKILIN